MTAPDPMVTIRYLRPPNREQTFRQKLILDRDDVKVTFAEGLDFDPPIRIEGRIALETGSDVVWFTFPGAWHDIGRFHRADGTFTGYYANVLTPVDIRDGGHWETTDLFLDVWLRPGGEPILLDEEEFDAAVGRAWIDADTAARVRQEAQRIVEGAREGRWPPASVGEWTRQRVLAARGGSGRP